MNRHVDSNWPGDMNQPSLVEQVTLLAEALSGSTLTELELIEDGLEIRLQRSAIPLVAAMPVPARQGSAPAPAGGQPDTAAEMSVAVLSPMMGIFYARPAPTSPPYVQPGDIVQPGQVVCVVEAMKVFNEVKTEIGGTVVAIPPQDKQLVKKGDPLVRIKPF